MPLVNVIRGEQVPNALLNVRTPVVRVPLWAAVSWWVLKGFGRLGVGYLRFWPVTLPVTVLAALYLALGWIGPVVLVVTVAVVGIAWWFGHRESALRFGWWPLLARYRRWRYDHVWHPAMVTAGLAVTFDRHTVLPILKRVRCASGVDVLRVRMVTGQIPDDFARVSERLAHTFGVRQVLVRPGHRPDLVVLRLMRGDPLAAVVPPLPVPAVPDFSALPVGRREDGGVYRLRLTGTHVLVVGATGSGKGSVIWSLVRALAGGVASGLVRVWAFDPKGGMELAAGVGLFDRFICDDFAGVADALEEAVTLMRQRTMRFRGHTRQHVPTPADPLYVLIVDELAALTAYLTDRRLRDRIRDALSLLLTQGRAVGVHVLAAIQDPRKEVLPFRDLFPTRVGLRLVEEAHVDMVLGTGMRDRGALCDRIPQHLPGVGYVVLDGDALPLRVRFSYLTDDDITDVVSTYAPDLPDWSQNQLAAARIVLVDQRGPGAGSTGPGR